MPGSTPTTTSKEETVPMPETAASRIAAKLASRQGTAPTKATEPDESEEEPTEAAESIEDSQDEPNDDVLPGEAETKPQSIKERAAAARAARNGKAEPEAEAKAPAKKATATKPATAAGKSKAQGSPKQIAAREAFAERSRAAAAARKAEAEDGDLHNEAPVAKTPKVIQAKAVVSSKANAKAPVQTPEQVKAKQNADRKAASQAAADAAANETRRTPTSKATKVTETKAQAAARARKEKAEAAPKLVVLKGGKAAKAAPAAKTAATKAKTPRVTNDNKAKVHALLAKGKSKSEIRDELGISYPSVVFHARSYEGEIKTARGSIFVDTRLDSEGKKLPGSKKETVSRSEAMRREWLAGKSIGDIGRQFEVKYQLAYTAIRPIMGEAEDDE